MSFGIEIEPVTDWTLVYRLALATSGKTPTGGPSDKWKVSIMRAMHSPIRALIFRVSFVCPYWVSVHLVRHKAGVEHFVQSQRTDRTGVIRDSLPQNAPVRHTMLLNAEAFVNISRKRLCFRASEETRNLWEEVVNVLGAVDPVVHRFCVPECVRSGYCPEMPSCGYAQTEGYRETRDAFKR